MKDDFRVVGLFGHPVGHSKSPHMHNAAFRHLGLPFVYMAFDVPSNGLTKAVESIRELGMRGVNVTIPHKVEIMDSLDEISDDARLIGAVNTVVNDAGRLIGYNTDGLGYVRSLTEETNINISSTRALVLGAGGAARAIVAGLVRNGAPRITLVNRTRDKATELAALFAPMQQVQVGTFEDLPDIVDDVKLIVNTTSVGMHPKVEGIPLDPLLLRDFHIVSDLIYNPRETHLLQAARQVGAHVHGGLGMFVYQGAAAFTLWTGEPAPIDIMRKEVEKHL